MNNNHTPQHKNVILNKNLGISSDDVEKCKDVMTLQRWLNVIDTDLAMIDSQIMEANTKKIMNGEYADPLWYAAVRTAKRLQTILKNQVHFRIMELKKKNIPMEFFIIEATKELVDEHTWSEIKTLSKERYTLHQINQTNDYE